MNLDEKFRIAYLRNLVTRSTIFLLFKHDVYIIFKLFSDGVMKSSLAMCEEQHLMPDGIITFLWMNAYSLAGTAATMCFRLGLSKIMQNEWEETVL